MPVLPDRNRRPIQTPYIAAPAAYDRNADPLTFDVVPGALWYYAVEVATQAELLDRANNGARRTPDNFYGSWADGLLYAPEPTRYALPQNVWQRLRLAPFLAYRLLTTSDSRWTQFQASVFDADWARAPRVELVDAAEDAAPYDTQPGWRTT